MGTIASNFPIYRMRKLRCRMIGNLSKVIQVVVHEAGVYTRHSLYRAFLTLNFYVNQQ